MKIMDSVRSILANWLSTGGSYSYFGDIGAANSGVNVTPTSAMQCAAVLACVRTISETIAGLPFHVYKEDGNNRVREHGHVIARLIHDEPNQYMTSFTFRDVMLSNLLLYGNAYAFIDHDIYSSHPIAIYPLQSNDVTAIKMNGELVYQWKIGSYLTPDQVIHLKDFSHDGIVGISRISQAKHSIGLSAAAEQYGSTFFANGGQPKGVLEWNVTANKETATKVKDDWLANFGRQTQSNKTAMLPPGFTYKNISVSPEDAQFLQTRKFQLAEIAAIFRCPPYVVGDNSASTFANLEQQGRQLVQHTLSPWISRIETEFTRKLFRENEQGLYSVRLNVDGLQRGDMAARQTYYSNGRQWGYLSQNDIRALENLPPIEGGDVYLQPVNMAPINSTSPTPPAVDRALIVDAVSRFNRKEVNAIRRAAKKHSNDLPSFKRWAEQFYADHRELVERSLSPVLKVLNRAGDAEKTAKEHCRNSLDAVVKSYQSGNITDLLEEWNDDRPDDMADAILHPQ